MQAKLLHCHNGVPGLAVLILPSRGSGAERSITKTWAAQLEMTLFFLKVHYLFIC